MSISKEHRAELERLKHAGEGDTEHYRRLEDLAERAGNFSAGPGRDDAAAHELSKQFNDLKHRHESRES
jgi:hypothetical protein